MDLEREENTERLDQATLETVMEPPLAAVPQLAAGPRPAGEADSEHSDPVFPQGNYVTTDIMERMLNNFASSMELRMAEMLRDRRRGRVPSVWF